MTIELFYQEFFGNTLIQYVYFICAIIGSFFIGKLFSNLSSLILINLSKRTKTQFDDFLVKSLKWPLIVIVVIIGVYFSFYFLNINNEMRILLDNLFFIALTIYIAWIIINIGTSFITHLFESTLKVFNVAPILNKTFKIIIWGITLLFIVSRFGYDITAILAGLGIGGIAIAFAAQKTIADVFGGLSIIFSRTFFVGQIIEVPSMNLSGTVVEIGIRNTKIKDFDGRINTVPNSDLSSSLIRNISSESTHRIIIDIKLPYSISIEKIKLAKELIKSIIESNSMCEKSPQILVNDFKDFYINLRVIYNADKNNWMQIQDEVNMHIKEQFDKNGIEFAEVPKRII